jgi:hypothetical protein
MSTANQAGALSVAEARAIAEEAYVYLYPLVTMDVTRRVSTNVPPDTKEGFGPANTFCHFRAYPTAEFRTVVRPNFDTLYSLAWLDLTREPLIVSVPDTDGRYYLLPMLDMWSNVFAVPGKRTSGTAAAHFALVPPGWSGALPPEAERLNAPTPYVWIVGRTQTNGPADYAAVHRVQDGYRITPFSRWGQAPLAATVSVDASVDMDTDPLDQVNNMSAAAFFTYAAELLKINPPHDTDWSIRARMRRIGLQLNLADGTGQPLEGQHRYVLHFTKDELPPVNAFWSATMYDAEGFQVANEIDRYAIGDRDALQHNADGSLDLYIQHERPAADRVANWLPAPAAGVLGITMRLYWPQQPVIEGRWNPPAVVRVS